MFCQPHRTISVNRGLKVSHFLEYNVLSTAHNNPRKAEDKESVNYWHKIISGRQKTKSQSITGVKCPVNHTTLSQETERTKSQSAPGVKCQVNLTEYSQEGRRQRVSQFLELNVLSTSQNNLRKAEEKESVSSWS